MNNILVSVHCPYCRKSLMDEKTHIGGHSSIRVGIQLADKQGILRLSSIYGSYRILSDFHIPRDEFVHVFCPHCRSSLMMQNLCDKCGAPVAFFSLKNGGKVQICSRRGCKYHSLDYTNMAQKITAFYKEYEVFADPDKGK